MLKNAPRRGMAGLSQTEVHHPSSLEEVFISANFCLERADEAFETARSGYNLDIAQQALSGSGGARDWMDKAFSFLAKAKAEHLTTPEEASKIASTILKPIGDQIANAQEQIVRGRDPLLNYWDAYKAAIVKITAATTGFVGERWKKAVDTYRDISTLIKSTEAGLLELSQGSPSATFSADLAQVKIALDGLKTVQKTIETAFTSNGIPLDYVKSEAGLGILPLLGVTLFTVGTKAITVGFVLYSTLTVILGSVVAALGFIYVQEGSIIPSWMKSKATLFQEALEREKFQKQIADELKRQDNEQLKALNDKNRATIDAKTKEGADTAKALAERFPQLGVTPGKIDEKVNKEAQKYGIQPGYQSDYTASEYFMAAAGGLVLASTIYYLWLRKK